MEFIGDQLEMLNVCADVINVLELQLDKAREAFRLTHRTAIGTLAELMKKFATFEKLFSGSVDRV